MVTLIAAIVAMVLSIIIIAGSTWAIATKRMDAYHMLMSIAICIVIWLGVCMIGIAEKQYLHNLAYH